MTTLTSLGFIGGGQMAEALVRGILAAGLLAPEHIHVLEPNKKRMASLQSHYSIQEAADEASLCASSQVLVAALKPQIAQQALTSYAPHLDRGHLLISIMAGIPLSRLRQYTGDQVRLIRAMPNTPALVLAGATVYTPAASATKEDCTLAQAIFNAVGQSLELAEQQLDAVTGLSGSGPGYVFTFLEALIDGGVLAGLPRPVAEQLALQTLYGTAKLAKESKEHPAVLKGKVTSPGGTTIAGIHALEQGAFRGLVMEAVQQATQRARDLDG